MKFSEWIKIKEQAAAAVPAAPAVPAPAPAPAPVNAAPGLVTSTTSGTMSSDVRPVPEKLFGSKKCCSKDYKNWYYTNKRKKKHV
jgi:hypothetical protein